MWHWQLDALLWRLKTQHPAEFARLERLVESRSPERARLTAVHIFEPLLEYYPSHGIERGGSDLDASEFVTFFRAGMTRERILLRRPAAPQRAQKVKEWLDDRVSREEKEIEAWRQKSGG